MRVSHIGAGVWVLGPSSAVFPDHKQGARWEWSIWDTNGHPYGMLTLASGALPSKATMLVPRWGDFRIPSFIHFPWIWILKVLREELQKDHGNMYCEKKNCGFQKFFYNKITWFLNYTFYKLFEIFLSYMAVTLNTAENQDSQQWLHIGIIWGH